MSLLDRFALDEASRHERHRFLGLTEDDAANVRELRSAFAAFATGFAERFYDHLTAEPKTAALLSDPAQLERLKAIQAGYFAELLEGDFGPAYYEKRLRVGQTHQHVGLEPAFYLGAYNQYVQLTFPLFARAFGDNTDRVLPLLLSLVKVIFLDIGLALDTYFHVDTEQLRARNEELQQALSMYLHAQRREEQLRKLLSHEVRGGLAAVITTMEDLLETASAKLDPDQAEQLEGVSKRCWSLSALLGEMLASGDASGPVWVETARIFENLVARFGLYAEGKAVRLDLPADPPRVWADAVQLREVFANLVSNAVRYLDKEPGRVTITWRLTTSPDPSASLSASPLAGESGGQECRPPYPHPPPQGAREILESPPQGGRQTGGGDGEGTWVLFCVEDDGPGIPPALRGRLFEPFVHGPTPPAGGSGLGLYFVKTIVEQGGGRVGVESAPGKGSRFWFTVPRTPRGSPDHRA